LKGSNRILINENTGAKTAPISSKSRLRSLPDGEKIKKEQAGLRGNF